MKSIIKRRAKSALAILLTLCMVMSVFTIGVVSASAATDNSEGVGATTTTTVYFKNTQNWSTVNVYFYSSAYWQYDNKDHGGSNGTCISGPNAMTVAGQLDGKDVYKYVFTTDKTWTHIAFTEASQSNYDHFYNTKIVACRTFDSTKPMIVPSSTKTSNNGCTVYSASNAAEPDLTITLNTPTNVKINSASTYAVNAGATSTTTLTWTGDSRASGYTIYKNGAEVGTTTGGSTTSYSITNATASAGTYTVRATTTNTSQYTNSAISTSSATLTVYEPTYCIVGNHVDWGAYLIDSDNDGEYDDEPSITQPTGTDNYFNTWQDALVINNPTATPGKYSFTFKTKEKEDYNWDGFNGISLCIYLKDVGQKAFVLDDEVYNTSAHGDITITDEGIDDDDELYVYDLATSTPGGSLKLKRGQTYTITIDQTQRYDSNSPYGKITITATDAYVDTAAKKQTYNPTNRSYDSVSDSADTIGTATAVPYHGEKSNFTSRLTATVVNNNYTFAGWFTNENCTGTAVSTEETYDVVNPSNSVTYYALFKQNQPSDYTVKVIQPDFGQISFTGGVASTGTENTTAYQGATVSINATVSDNSKEFSHWLITADNTGGADITSTVCTNPSQATTTFNMPAQNVKVTAIYANRTVVNITTSSNNNELGTASYDDGTYYVGDEIDISAANVNGVFTRWVLTGASFKTGSTATSKDATIIASGSTVTARAIFDYKSYQLYYNGKYYPLIRQDDGSYVSTFKIPSNSSEFTVYNASDKKYAVSGTGNTWEFNSGTRDATIYNSTTANNSAWASSVGKQYKNISAGAAAYMVFYPPGYKIGNTTYGNGRISLVTTNPMGDIAEIYAKDGSVRYANGGTAQGGGASSGELWSDGGDITAKKGVTEITKIDNASVTDPDSSRYPDTASNSEHLKIYSAPIGSTITIQTTVNSTYANQGFYVGMFVINGWKVAATDAGKGVYTATYTLTDEYAINNLSSTKSFEITPVYYNKNFEYITFYVDAASVPEKWGKTISTCADYNGATYAHFEGSYPGQPLGREGDLYEIKIAKYYYDYSSSTGKWTSHVNYHPSATITAYNYDSVHHYYYVYGDDNVNTSNNKNYQTYDYADFAYLAQIEDIEAILFRCKYETSKNNWAIYANSDANPPTANYNAKVPTWWAVDDHAADKLNSFQLLTDYYGNPIDALGNRILKSGSTTEYYSAEDAKNLTYTKDDTSQIRIVSYGNRKTDDDTANSRTAAKWATGWAVFQGGADGTNRQIAYGTPADFIATTPGTASTANVHYLNSKNSSALTGKLTFISYDNEKTNSISGVGDTGERIDGQWYYSAQHDFDSTVQVHITTDSGTAVTKAHTSVDADSSAAGTNDGWEGTTSKSVATLDGKTTETYSNVTTEAQLNATVGAGYTFVGWYIYDGTTYTKIHDNFVDQNTTMTMKKNYTIVAVVRKVAAGDLVITHSRYTGPGANDGTGKYYVSAVVNKGQANEKTIPEALNSITVQNLQSTDKLTITIRTVCNGADTFYAWYEEALGDNYSRTGNYYEICSEDVDPIGEKEVSYTFFEADCSTFFKNGTLARNTIDLYSDITHVSAYAKLTYKYYDRFAQNGKGQMVSYVVKDVPLSDTEIDNGYIPSDEKIAQYAPKVVDTIYTDTKWSIVGTKVERAASNVTLMATQTAKTCYVQYLPNDVVGNYLLKSTGEETGVRDVTAWNTRIVDFNTWLINDDANLDAPDESDFYVSAPTTYTYEGTTWNFDRFDIYEFDRLTGIIGNVIYSTNDNVFGYRIYADCVIYPVYTKDSDSKVLTARIEPAVLNREVYGDSTSPVDRLYADLIISFINIAAATDGNVPEVIKENNTEYTIETGVILDKSVELNDTDYNTIKHAAETGQTDTTSSIISGYTGFTDEDVVKTFAQTAVADSKTRQVTEDKLTKYVNKNSDLTNKNRLDKVFRYTNSTDAQKRIFAAYSYVLIKKNGTEIAFAISGVQKFNFCYTGNKPLSTLS